MNETLLTTLNETLNELKQQQAESNARLLEARTGIERANTYLQKAKEQEGLAIHEDEEIKKQQRELLAYHNSLPLAERTHALTNKINRLNAEQLKTFAKREEATEIVKQQELEVNQARRNLALLETNHRQIQKDWEDIAIKIQRLN